MFISFYFCFFLFWINIRSVCFCFKCVFCSLFFQQLVATSVPLKYINYNQCKLCLIIFAVFNVSNNLDHEINYYYRLNEYIITITRFPILQLQPHNCCLNRSCAARPYLYIQTQSRLLIVPVFGCFSFTSLFFVFENPTAGMVYKYRTYIYTYASYMIPSITLD